MGGSDCSEIDLSLLLVLRDQCKSVIHDRFDTDIQFQEMPARDTKRRATTEFERSFKRRIADLPNTSTTRYISPAGQSANTSAASSQVRKPELPFPPLAPPPVEPLVTSTLEHEGDELDPEKRTQVSSLGQTKYQLNTDYVLQTAQVIEDFLAIETYLQDLLLSRYANPHEGETCSCGSGKRLVRCEECFQYPISCVSCFVRSHRTLPFHWAFVWDTTKRIWSKFDSSELSAESAIQLGHIGKHEACTGVKSALTFKITHVNGIHTCKLRFCGCPGAPDKVTQLMLADLFPGTTSDPQSAFTFTVLKEFHLHNLQSKCGAFDYIHSLRRLTNDTTIMKVPVSLTKASWSRDTSSQTGSLQGILESDSCLGLLKLEEGIRSS